MVCVVLYCEVKSQSRRFHLVPSDKVQEYEGNIDILVQESGIRNFSKSLHFLNQGAPNKLQGGVSALRSSQMLSRSRNHQPFVKCEEKMLATARTGIHVEPKKLSASLHPSYFVIAPPPI
jgi:hypothetical protein